MSTDTSVSLKIEEKVAILGLPSLPGAVPPIYIALLASFEIISAKQRNGTSKRTGFKGGNFIEQMERELEPDRGRQRRLGLKTQRLNKWPQQCGIHSLGL